MIVFIFFAVIVVAGLISLVSLMINPIPENNKPIRAKIVQAPMVSHEEARRREREHRQKVMQQAHDYRMRNLRLRN